MIPPPSHLQPCMTLTFCPPPPKVDHFISLPLGPHQNQFISSPLGPHQISSSCCPLDLIKSVSRCPLHHIKSLHLFSKCRVRTFSNGRMHRRTSTQVKNIMPPAAVSLACQSSCQSGLPEALLPTQLNVSTFSYRFPRQQPS